ncbi:MAG: Gfo/Idh/MocA family protein [Gemmatimonadota bacterium]
MAADRTRLRLGVVGCGRVFELYHRQALDHSDRWELVAACDVSAQRREWVRRALPEVRVFDSPTGLLAGHDLDAVLVATPPDLHAEVALQAMESGLNVLVEKPMATRLTDARRMLDAAEAAGTALCVGFNRRFRSSYRKVRDELAAEPRTIREIRYSFAADVRWRGESRSPVPIDLLLHDVACHQIDLVAWMTGLAIRETRARPLAEADGPGGAVQVDLGLGPDRDFVARCTAAYAPRYVERLEVDLGDRTLVVRPGGLSRSGRTPDRLSEAWDRIRHLAHLSVRRAIGRPSRTHESFERQLASFADAIRDAPSGCADAGDGYRAVAVVEACRESLADGGAWKAVHPHRALAGA